MQYFLTLLQIFIPKIIINLQNDVIVILFFPVKNHVPQALNADVWYEIWEFVSRS